MTSLAQLQQALQNSIVEANSKLAEGIVTDGIDSATRLGIYATAYRLRLIEALAANFPRLSNFVGVEAFSLLAQRYLERHPSRTESVRWFGDRLEQFLRDEAEFASQPWLAELAQWEWEIAAAFDAPDTAPIELQALNVAPEDWPRLRFELHPSVRTVRLATAAVRLFREMQSGVDAPTDPGADPSLLLDKSQSYLIWRQDLDVRFREQADDEAHALTLVGQGATFEALCDGLCDWIDAEHVPIRAASLLKTWIFEGLLATVTIEA